MILFQIILMDNSTLKMVVLKFNAVVVVERIFNDKAFFFLTA